MAAEIERVIIEDTASPAEVEAVDEAFARAGLEVEVRPYYVRRSAGALPWVVHITLAVPIAAFFAAIGAAAGQDAYAAAKAWAQDVFQARGGSGSSRGAVNIEDPERTNLVLHSELSDEALDALRAIDWKNQRGSYLVWDENERAWRDGLRRN